VNCGVAILIGIVEDMAFFDTLWHKTLKRPYKLTRVLDQGRGTPVLFLHGLGGSATAWKYVIDGLANSPIRVIALDLLGFGTSPKPTWPDYDVQEHARAVIGNIEKLKLKEPITIVGHSMGCLIAVHIARLKPKLVRQLVLYEMPLYEGLPDKKRYTVRRDLYYNIYKRVLKHPEFDPENARRVQLMAAKLVGFEVNKETWIPFVRSLENTVMHQTTLEDLKHLSTPTEVIYGSLDAVVIRGKARHIFGDSAPHIKTSVVRDIHAITPKSSAFIAAQVRELLFEDESKNQK
jgi:cis-3-alkyl-4-acyloxetan-2-one decarboxylase